MKVQITENGKVIMTLTTDQFMQIAKENFGIGRQAFLQDYINRFNEVKANDGMTAKVSI